MSNRHVNYVKLAKDRRAIEDINNELLKSKISSHQTISIGSINKLIKGNSANLRH